MIPGPARYLRFSLIESRLLLYATFLSIVFFLCAGVSNAAAQALGLVTDLQGGVRIKRGDMYRPLIILAVIEEGDRIQVDAGSSVNVLYSGTGDEFIVRGPATMRLDRTEVVSMTGEQPVRASNRIAAMAPGLHIPPQTVVQGGIIMRYADSAIHGRRSLANITFLDSAHFEWPAVPGAKGYRFQASDVNGRLISEFDSIATNATIPSGFALPTGTRLFWEAWALLPNGKRALAASGFFSVADDGLRKYVETMRPKKDSSISEKVVFAIWLDQQSLRDEAKRYWRAAKRARPDDPELRNLAQ